MNIRVLDDYEVRYMDPSNLRVWQYKALDRGKRKGEMDWVALDSYHQSLASAVEWIAKHASRCRYGGVEADLAGAVDLLRDIEKDIAKHARAFEKAFKAVAS